MKSSLYKELSKTPEGRKNAHDIMLEDVKNRIDKLVNGAPESTRQKASKVMEAAFEKISKLGNGQLFSYFADDENSDNNFIRYVSDLLKGKF